MVEHGPVAQGIEHRFPKPGVVGSNPTGVTMKCEVSGLGRWPFSLARQCRPGAMAARLGGMRLLTGRCRARLWWVAARRLHMCLQKSPRARRTALLARGRLPMFGALGLYWPPVGLVVVLVVPLLVVVLSVLVLAPLVAGSGPLEITRVIVAPLLALVADCETTVPCATLELYW